MNDPVALYGLIAGSTFVFVYVWVSLTLSALFAKAGEKGWKAWVPVYSLFTLFELGGLSGWLVLLGFVPILGGIAFLVVAVFAYHRVNVAFGHGTGMTVLAVLLFPVWTSVIGWGSARWLGREDGIGPKRRGEAALGDRIAGSPVPPRPPLPGTDATTGYARTGAVAATPSTAAGAGFDDVSAPASRESAGVGGGWAPPSPAPAAADLPTPTPAADGAPAAPVPAPDTAPVATPPAPPAVHRPRPREQQPVETQPLDLALDEDLRPGRSHVPYTRTDGSYAPGDEPRAPAAAAREAFTPTRAADSTAAQQRAVAQAAMRDAARQADEGAERVEDAGEGVAGLATPVAASDPVAPVQAVPAAPARSADPWAPPLDAAAPDGFDTSGEVSAIVGAPEVGTPRSARASVSAQHNVRELPDSEEAFDETIIASRRRTEWMLTPPLGAAIAVTADVLILGRRPTSDSQYPDAQLVPIADDTRTVSKTHARLERQDGGWTIVDLDSTNGVVLLGQNGTEVDATPGRPERVTERFLLGDAELTLAPSGA